MSIKEVIDKAAAIEGWKLERFPGGMCVRNGYQCPVSSLDIENSDIDSWEQVAEKFGVALGDAKLIADASDDYEYTKARLVRRYMLRVMGLEESQ